MRQKAPGKRRIARAASSSKIDVPPKSLQLCARCGKIDLEILDHPERIKTSLGSSIVNLGSPDAWSPATCTLCRLLRLLVAQSTDEAAIEQRDTWVYHLYAYSSRRSYAPGYNSIGKPKGSPRTLIGVIPAHEIRDTSRGSLNRNTNRYKHRPDSAAFIARCDSTAGSGFQLNAVPARIDFSVVKRWLQNCVAWHGDHKYARLRLSENPNRLRLIDCRTRSIVPAAPNDKYVALSYVWGAYQEPCGSSIDTLPACASAVIEDAITVVLSLGLQFLWADRYCIRQDDDEDKHTQIANMDVIYRRAMLTVIAAAGNGAEHGLPGVGQRLRHPGQPVDVGGLPLLVTPGDPSRRVKMSTWMTRGWVYQEAILSQRRLIFTDQQVYFECEMMTCRETIDTIPEINRSKSKRQWHQTSIFPPIGDNPGDIKQHISDYSKKRLSYDSDILNGIMGIFKAYDTMFGSFHHFFGVPLLEPSWHSSKELLRTSAAKQWTMRLLDGFLWISEKPSPRRPGFPSWSWCGWKGSAGWISDSFLVPDPSVTIQVEISEDDSLKVVDFESIPGSRTLLGNGSHDIASRLRIDALIIQLRFEYLPHGPPLEWEVGSRFHNGPGYYARLHNRKLSTVWFAPLYLDIELELDSELGKRLMSEFWDCVVIGFDQWRKHSASHVAVVCEWNGDTARRIGLVTISRSVGGDGVYDSSKGMEYITSERRLFILE